MNSSRVRRLSSGRAQRLEVRCQPPQFGHLYVRRSDLGRLARSRFLMVARASFAAISLRKRILKHLVIYQ